MVMIIGLYFRFSLVRLNQLKNKLLANYLRNRGNDLATMLFPNSISLSFKYLQNHFMAIGNGFVTCYLLYLASNRSGMISYQQR